MLSKNFQTQDVSGGGCGDGGGDFDGGDFDYFKMAYS